MGTGRRKKDKHIAIRDDAPSYLGVRRTLEFYNHDATKTDWVIHEYRQG